MNQKNYLLFLLFYVTAFYPQDRPVLDYTDQVSHELFFECALDYRPFIDLTEKKYFSKRKNLKIEAITVKYIGSPLDSVYSKNKRQFQFLVDHRHYYHDIYSYVEIYHFNEDGFTTSKKTYPISLHLQKKDSITAERDRLTSFTKADSLISTLYNDDSSHTKTVYSKNISYSLTKSQIPHMIRDSLHVYRVDKTTPTISPTYYNFDKEGHIKTIKQLSPDRSYELSFQYPKLLKTLVSNKTPDIRPNEWAYYENEITKNSKGQLLKSKFYNKGDTTYYACYDLKYDNHGNLLRVDYFFDSGENYKYTKNIYKFKHTYKQGKLYKTRAPQKFSDAYREDIYFYNEQGLVSEIQLGTYRIFFEYSMGKE